MKDAARRRSNAEISRVTLDRLRAYLADRPLPLRRDGTIVMSALAREAGVDRQFIYANDQALAAVRDAAAQARAHLPSDRSSAEQEDGLAEAACDVPGRLVDARALSRAEQRIKSLEEQLAVSKVEVGELRSRLRRLTHVEDAMLGRGVMPR